MIKKVDKTKQELYIYNIESDNKYLNGKLDIITSNNRLDCISFSTNLGNEIFDSEIDFERLKLYAKAYEEATRILEKYRNQICEK